MLHKFFFITLPEILGTVTALLILILTYMNINPLEF